MKLEKIKVTINLEEFDDFINSGYIDLHLKNINIIIMRHDMEVINKFLKLI